MSDPRIRYDVLANAQGGEDVRRLAAELEKLDDSFDPAIQARAKALADQLRQLGAQREGIDTFSRLKRETDEARQALDQAQQAAQKLAREISATAAPTRAQTGEFEKLRDAVNRAELELQAKTQATITARVELAKLGVSTTDLAATNVRLEASTRKVREEVAQLGQQGGALQGFTQLVRTTEEARAAFDQADRALEAYQRQLQGVADPTLAQQRLLARLNEEARASQQAFQAASLAQAQQATALRAAGVDTDRLVAAQQRLPPQLTATAAAARQVVDGYGDAGRAAAASAAQQTAANNTVAGSLQGLRGQLQTVQNLAAVAIGGGVFGGVIRDVTATADAYANLQARIRLVTGEGDNFTRGFEGVFDVARRTNSAVEETSNLFTRLAKTGTDAGLSTRAATEQALALTETINQATQLSGGSAESARAAITQLIQGLQSGVLRGEEFNSVLEQAPRLAQALAEGLGRTTGELRELANAGALSTDVVIKALQSQSAAVQREFAQLPPTVGRALQGLSTEWTRYIGEVDQANGVSVKAAEAIGFLANNLQQVAGLVTTAGQAWLAYKALDLAGTLAAQVLAQRGLVAAQAAETAARVGATGATVANTAAVVANTAAKSANAVATGAAAAADAAGAAASAASNASLATRVGTLGRLTGALGLVGVATALSGDLLVKLGTFIGETVAKWRGYTDRSAEVAEADKKAAEASRQNAAAKAELAAKTEAASDASLGLTKTSKDLIGEFEGVTSKGGSAAEAVDKLSKALQIDSVQGIRDAGTALDELARRGTASASAVERALQQALNGKDLAVFEANARAAFDGTVRGAERLELALRAAVGEALRRTGVDLVELTDGISQGAASAINDVELLTKSLDRLREQGVDTNRALSASLNKATEASNTERALVEVIRRWEELGRTGQVTGTQLTEGLEKARKKLDELRPGINSLDEALRELGLKTRAELTDTANRLGEAYARVAQSGQVSLQEQVSAYERWREAALAANGGVETSQLQLQRVILQNKGAVLDLGGAFEDGMARGKRATRELINEQEALVQAARTAAGALVSGSSGLGGIDGSTSITGRSNALPPVASGPSAGSFGELLNNTPSGGTTRVVDTGQAVNRPSSGEWTYTLTGWTVPGVDANGRRLAGGWAPVRGPSGVSATPFAPGNTGIGSVVGLPPRPPVPSPAPRPPNTATPSAATPPVLGRFEVRLGSASAFTDSEAQARAFINELERAAQAQGGF